MKTKISIWWILIIAIAFFALCRQCEGEPKVTSSTKVNISQIIDSVKQATLKSVKPVYIDTSKTVTKWEKGRTIYKDSIIYVETPNDNTITANQYETKLESNKATAYLKITTTGELLDVSGVITYPEKETITETTITNDASGLYLYGNTSINSFTSSEIGLMFQFKNKGGIMLGGQYNNITKQAEVKVGALIKIL